MMNRFMDKYEVYYPQLDRCPDCGVFLPGALKQIGAATTSRVVCRTCWDKRWDKRCSVPKEKGRSPGGPR